MAPHANYVIVFSVSIHIKYVLFTHLRVFRIKSHDLTSHMIAVSMHASLETIQVLFVIQF